MAPRFTADELERRLPPSPLGAAETLADLGAQGLAERDDAGRWTLTSAGWPGPTPRSGMATRPT